MIAMIELLLAKISKMKNNPIEFRSKRKWLWRYNGQARMKWDILIMILSVINWFQVPYQVSFDNTVDDFILIEIINYMIDLSFFIDVFVNFRTSYFNSTKNVEITDSKLIAIQYLKTRFWLDFISSTPFDYLLFILPSSDVNSTSLKLFSLLKLVRVLRLGRLIAHMNIKNEFKTSLKLIKLVFFIVIILHLMACTWYYIVKQDQTWIPPLDYSYPSNDLYQESKFFSVLDFSLQFNAGDLRWRHFPNWWAPISFLSINAILWSNHKFYYFW